MPTVFITGASSGIGLETAKLFREHGWNLVATMRTPEKSEDIIGDNTLVTRCDVTDLDSIGTAVDEAMARFGSIDVLVNNAGYYAVGVFENSTPEQRRRQIDTNLMGLMDVTQKVLPHMRTQGSGVIINISSIAGVISIPLQSLYNASKWAIEGFSEALHYELRPFGIRVKIIEPGVVKTNFLGRSMTRIENVPEYEPYATDVLRNIFTTGETGSDPCLVAKKIFEAATDSKTKMRYRVGKNSHVIPLRSILPTGVFISLIRRIME